MELVSFFGHGQEQVGAADAGVPTAFQCFKERSVLCGSTCTRKYLHPYHTAM